MDLPTTLRLVNATSLVAFEVAEHRLALPDTALDMAWVDGRVDVIGPMSVARPSRYAIGTRVTLLALDPASASRWLGVPLSTLTDTVTDLRDIHGEHAKVLEAMFETGSITELLRPSTPDASRADVAVRSLTQGATVRQVAEAVNLSERHLSRSFQYTLGLHPKRFQRIRRLRRAVEAAKRGNSLVAAALEAGYADQAHFSREVRALTGATLRALLPNVGNVQDVAPRIV